MDPDDGGLLIVQPQPEPSSASAWAAYLKTWIKPEGFDFDRAAEHLVSIQSGIHWELERARRSGLPVPHEVPIAFTDEPSIDVSACPDPAVVLVNVDLLYELSGLEPGQLNSAASFADARLFAGRLDHFLEGWGVEECAHVIDLCNGLTGADSVGSQEGTIEEYHADDREYVGLAERIEHAQDRRMPRTTVETYRALHRSASRVRAQRAQPAPQRQGHGVGL